MFGVSIITPCYNAGAFLPGMINSVRAARPDVPYEIIVVDDASTDPATRQLVSGMTSSDPVVRIFRQSVNQGQSAARNVALREAKYDYILPLDADDQLNPAAPGYLAQAARILSDSPDTLIVCCNARHYGAASGPFLQPAYSEQRLLTENVLPVFSVYRRDEALKVGGYAEAMRHSEDWELWLALHSGRFASRMTRQIVRLPDPHVLYRRHVSGSNASVAEKRSPLETFAQLSRRASPLYRHYLGTAAPEAIAASRPNTLVRAFRRGANAGGARNFVHFAADLLWLRIQREMTKRRNTPVRQPTLPAAGLGLPRHL